MMFNNKDLLRIITPLLISQLLSVTIGLADSLMVANAGEAAVSGVSLVNTINLLISYVLSALATGGSVVCSQLLGRKDPDPARRCAKQLLYTTAFVGIAIMLIVLTFRSGILNLIFGKIEWDVMANAKVYMLITAVSYPFLAVYDAGAAVFRAMGNTKVTMTVSISMNVINVIGNAILIFGFHMGAAGAAVATLISRIFGAVIPIILLRNKHNVIYIEKLFTFRPDYTTIRQILAIGIPNGLENGMFQFGKIITQSLISTFGTAVIAANAVANTLSNFEYAVGGAIGMTMITVVGRCVGAGERSQAKYYAGRLLGYAYVFIVPVALIISLLAEPIIDIYNLSPGSGDIAFVLIIFHNICVSTIWPFAFTLPNSFRASSDVRYPMIMSVLSMWVFRVGLSYVFALGFDMGIMGVWYAMAVDWIFRAVLYAVRFFRGTWLTKYSTK